MAIINTKIVPYKLPKGTRRYMTTIANSYLKKTYVVDHNELLDIKMFVYVPDDFVP